ncbi:hypothetical protein BU17DRAFT_72598 [Hysterangium stoloniferum]|nr:hypothetical protein BU17DRAFT_72598 [Hysterangium stoloniferum]
MNKFCKNWSLSTLFSHFKFGNRLSEGFTLSSGTSQSWPLSALLSGSKFVNRLSEGYTLSSVYFASIPLPLSLPAQCLHSSSAVECFLRHTLAPFCHLFALSPILSPFEKSPAFLAYFRTHSLQYLTGLFSGFICSSCFLILLLLLLFVTAF